MDNKSIKGNRSTFKWTGFIMGILVGIPAGMLVGELVSLLIEIFPELLIGEKGRWIEKNWPLIFRGIFIIILSSTIIIMSWLFFKKGRDRKKVIKGVKIGIIGVGLALVFMIILEPQGLITVNDDSKTKLLDTASTMFGVTFTICTIAYAWIKKEENAKVEEIIEMIGYALGMIGLSVIFAFLASLSVDFSEASELEVTSELEVASGVNDAFFYYATVCLIIGISYLIFAIYGINKSMIPMQMDEESESKALDTKDKNDESKESDSKDVEIEESPTNTNGNQPTEENNDSPENKQEGEK